MRRMASGMSTFLAPEEHELLAAACERLVPGDEHGPGARAAGAADYIDGLLGAFLTDPPRIWAGGPYSGRHGGDDGFASFLPLGRLEELAWRTRIEGSLGIPEREFNGAVKGWQETYRDGLAALGADFAAAPPGEQDARLDAGPEFKALLFEHVCEGLYGDPAYGGNRDGMAWREIDFPGDSQPRGWTDEEVAGRD